MFDFVPAPRTTPVITLRLSEGGIEWLDNVAREHGVSRTAVMKACFAFAAGRQADFDRMMKKKLETR